MDTFNRLELVYYWKEGRSVQKLAEATLLDGFSSLKSDLDKALYAAFPLEVAYRAAQEDEPSHELYAALGPRPRRHDRVGGRRAHARGVAGGPPHGCGRI